VEGRSKESENANTSKIGSWRDNDFSTAAYKNCYPTAIDVSKFIIYLGKKTFGQQSIE
jgi:hypothetical protein